MPKAVILTDGPHMLKPPTTRVFMRLQQLGFAISDQFSLEALTNEVGDSREFDLAGLAKHLLAMLEIAEHDEAWNVDTVADAMDFSKLNDYYTALIELYNEAFDDPKDEPS